MMNPKAALLSQIRVRVRVRARVRARVRVRVRARVRVMVRVAWDLDASAHQRLGSLSLGHVREGDRDRRVRLPGREGWDGRAGVASMGGKQVMGASRRRTLSLALALTLPSTHLHVGHEGDRVLRGVRGLAEGVVQVERLLLG